MRDKYLRKLNIELIDGEFENPLMGQVRDPEQVYDVFKSIKDKEHETALGVYLTPELDVLAYDVLSVGAREEVSVLTHQLFRHVIVSGGKDFIFIHNHPKGDPTPSDDDKLMMLKIAQGAIGVDLVFLDFIIVGRDSYWSMFENAEGGEYALGAINN